MPDYFELLADAGMIAWVVIGLFITIFAWWGFRIVRGRGKRKAGDAELPSDESYESISQEVRKAAEGDVIIGKGKFKCLCFRTIAGILIADFTTISEPVGEMYQFDPSCPISGPGYIVKQLATGEVVDYDPRAVEYVLKESPEFAWLATNGDTIIKAFWQSTVPWWKSTSVWFAAAMLVIIFISSLVVFD